MIKVNLLNSRNPIKLPEGYEYCGKAETTVITRGSTIDFESITAIDKFLVLDTKAGTMTPLLEVIREYGVSFGGVFRSGTKYDVACILRKVSGAKYLPEGTKILLDESLISYADDYCNKLDVYLVTDGGVFSLKPEYNIPKVKEYTLVVIDSVGLNADTLEESIQKHISEDLSLDNALVVQDYNTAIELLADQRTSGMLWVIPNDADTVYSVMSGVRRSSTIYRYQTVDNVSTILD